ncbi:unnamed protein product [Ilex paraguariensis]|uniref:Uncharacterized protein n=1 Tax=Ilex paraguariensis TaxID=185542 RepID=A0ABC8QQJ9_9AQUA
MGQEVIHGGVEIAKGAGDFKAQVRKTFGRANRLPGDFSQLLGGACRRERAREGDGSRAGDALGAIRAFFCQASDEGDVIKRGGMLTGAQDAKVFAPGGISGGGLFVPSDSGDLDVLGDVGGGSGTLGNSRKYASKSSGSFGRLGSVRKWPGNDLNKPSS